MGQLTSQKCTLAHDSQASVVQSAISCKNRPVKLASRPIKFAIYALTAASATTILMGCQTNTKLSQSNQTSATAIYFSVAGSQA